MPAEEKYDENQERVTSEMDGESNKVAWCIPRKEYLWPYEGVRIQFNSETAKFLPIALPVAQAIKLAATTVVFFV
jgi:hypothetical protein